MGNRDCAVCLLKSKAAENLGKDELQLLGKSCVGVTFHKGEIIFKQGALSSNIIYLQTGLVKLIIEGPQRTQILRLKKAPSYLGMPTTMGDKINHYSAVALEETTACFIGLETFKELLKISPEFSYEIMIDLCKNELEQFHRCVKLVQNQIYGRLASHILHISDEIYSSVEFDLPLSRNEIADLVCTSRETVSRLLTDLAKDHIIDVKGKHIQILNKKRLEQIAEKG